VIQKCKILKTIDNRPRVDHAILRDTTIKPTATSQTLQAWVNMQYINICDSSIRKGLDKYGLLGREVGAKNLLSKEEHGGRDQVCKDALIQYKVLWMTKVEMFGHN